MDIDESARRRATPDTTRSFVSDNTAPVAPAVFEALQAANEVDQAYGNDRLTARLDGVFSDLFGTDCAVLCVTTGTAANCIALATMVPPHGAVLCHQESHINADEGGAPEFFTHGAKLITVAGPGAKIDGDAVSEAREALSTDVHQVQPHVVSISNATEYGLFYRPHEVEHIAHSARLAKMSLHMDGARFANAVAGAECHPGDISWRAGVDALSFGFIKNGGLSAEALIYFNKDLVQVARWRRMRSGHLSSKARYQAAQLLALIENDLWLTNARAANASAQAIAEVASDRLAHPVETNEVFMHLTADEAANLRAEGFQFRDWGRGRARFVTSWHQSISEIQILASAIERLGPRSAEMQSS